MSDGKLFKKTTIITMSPDDLRSLVWEYLHRDYPGIRYDDIQFNAILDKYSLPVLKDCTVKLVDEEET